MKWYLLKQNNCPSCSKTFEYGAFIKRKGFIACNTPSCGFVISEKRYSEIVNSQITQDLEDKWNAQLEE